MEPVFSGVSTKFPPTFRQGGQRGGGALHATVHNEGTIPGMGQLVHVVLTPASGKEESQDRVKGGSSPLWNQGVN